MIKIEEQKATHNGIDIHLIPTKKYKTITLVAKLKTKLTRETATKRALLSYILEKGTTNYPSEKKLQMKLDELYGATFGIYCGKLGENHIITFRMEIANEKYIKQATGILEETIELFAEMMTKPHTDGNAFPETTVKREKTTLQSKLKSMYDDKMAYANNRLIDEMYADEPYATRTYGYQEDIDAITASDLYDYYKNDVLQNDKKDIYVIGDVSTTQTIELIKAAFTETIASPASEKELPTERLTRDTKDVRVIQERQPIQQAKLHIGYRTHITFADDDYAALRIFNCLFGGIPSSKLFVNVREKHSLAYYAGSRIEGHQGLMIVLSGIEPIKETAAREIIAEQLQAMQDGDFTEEEVEEVKAYMIGQVKETLDSAVGTVELLYNQVVGEKAVSPADYIGALDLVTKDDVVRVANKITTDTVYVLTSEGDNQDE